MMFSGLLGLFWSSTTIPAEPSALAVLGPTTESSLPQGLTVLTTAEEVVYTSPWLKVSLSLRPPTMTFLSVDATGTSRHSRNLLKAPLSGGPAVSTPLGACTSLEARCAFSRTGNVVRYAGVKLGQWETESLCFQIGRASCR